MKLRRFLKKSKRERGCTIPQQAASSNEVSNKGRPQKPRNGRYYNHLHGTIVGQAKNPGPPSCAS
eukprot:5795490-Prorocentrum_lima.AAC.1